MSVRGGARARSDFHEIAALAEFANPIARVWLLREMMILAAILALLVGGSLGLFGGGGSVLMVPTLVYALGVEPRDAIAMSLLVVGTTSAVTLLSQRTRGLVHLRTGLLFGSAGMGGAVIGGKLSALVPAVVLLVAFALIMLLTAAAMLRSRQGETSGRAAAPVVAGVSGIAVGLVSGLIGVGGGVLAVPALVLGAGLSLRGAIATSLLVIAMQSLAGFMTHAGHVALDWQLTGVVTLLAIAGSAGGGWVAKRLPQDSLRKGFAFLIALVAALVLFKEITAVAPALAVEPAWLRALAGGLLIGLAAAVLWLGNGRIAGISGIAGGLLGASVGDRVWRGAFLLGLIGAGVLLSRLLPTAFAVPSVSNATVVVAGLLVGVGTTLANGCTSGHGVCGVSRLSPRSLVATGSFISAGILTVYAARRLLELAL